MAKKNYAVSSDRSQSSLDVFRIGGADEDGRLLGFLAVMPFL